ncbi:MAG: hypothetical protein CL440_05065 [Acidimicrobiaceae bacterium]|nr:hypothetical protein [Acidimicrobiaceae bacterium]
MQLSDKDKKDLQKSFRNLTTFTSLLAKVTVEDLPEEVTGPTIYAANHRSLADLLIAGPTFLHWGTPIRALVAASYFKHPVIGPLLRALKCIPVSGLDAIDEAAKALEDGWSVAIMPEGRVVPKDEWEEEGVGKGHIGIGKLAKETNFPVVVSGASGSELLWPRGNYLPYFKPWKRQEVSLCCEYLGAVNEETFRDSTDEIMEGVRRCVLRAEKQTGIER